jgi:outer membrane protein TolC
MQRFVLTKTRFALGAGLLLLAEGQGQAQTPLPLAKEPMQMPATDKGAPATAPAKKAETPPVSAEPVTRYALSDAIAAGMANHPSIKALRASMNAAMLKMQGLHEVHRKGGLFLPDLETRRKQSEMGLQATQAELAQAEYEVTYAVIRCFYTVVYAREQSKVAKDLVDQLEVYLEQVKKIVNNKGGIRGISKDTEDKLVIAVSEAKGKLYEAESGIQRGQALLREALGLDPTARIDVADELLPEIKAEIARDIAIAHATTRRGEVTMAQLNVAVTELEVCAQWSRRLMLQMPTFAAGADLHAKPIPTPSRDPDYRPGAIGPEMPGKLVGKRETRAAIAQQYAERGAEAARQVRSLIGLEADMAYAKWIEASKKIVNFREAAKAGRDLVERQREASGGNLTKEDILMNELSAAKAFASFNEALFEQILALANLERITAGGVRVNFPGR